jgi:AAA domain
MTQTFLREVRLTNFRTFGEFTLNVPPGPGLTLLVGTNGLGKSSFFDGLEWCLTGNVRRFQPYVGRLTEGAYLTRRDATAGSHRVSLAFSEGEPLVRTADQLPSPQALADLLKQPLWTDIEDIGAYLAFTHFLGQASQQRFTSRGQADQWQSLKGPSGIERLESVRTALRGRPTTNAFVRRMEREDLAVQLAVKAIESWQAAVVRMAELQVRGAAAGAESLASLDARLSQVEQSVSAVNGESEDYVRRLSMVRLAIDTQQKDLARSRAARDDLAALVTRFSNATALIDANGPRLAAAVKSYTVATNAASEAMLSSTKAAQAAAVQAEVLARGEAVFAQRVEIRSALADLDALEIERKTAHAAGDALRAERDACQEDGKAAQVVLARAREIQEDIARLDGEESKLLLWVKRIDAWQARSSAVNAQRAAAASSGIAATQARVLITELQKTASTARAAEASAESRLALRRRNASQISELVAGLAAHIGHEDIHCPVCESTFLEGELQARARRALAAQDEQLAGDVSELGLLKTQTASADQRLQDALALISADDAATAAVKSADAEVMIERSTIAIGLGVSIDSDLPLVVSERSAEAARARAAHLGNAGGAPTDVASAQSRVEELFALLTSLDERLAAVEQWLARVEGSMRSIEDRLRDLPKPWSIDAADVAIEQQREQAALEGARLQELTQQRAIAANAEAAARERLAAFELERAQIAAAIDSGELERKAAIDGWRHAGMSDEPSVSALEMRDATIVARASALATHLEEVNALSRSHEAMVAQTELRDLRTTMEQEGGPGASENPAAHERQLQDRLESTRAAHRLTSATRDVVLSYGEHLKAEAERFSHQFLEPLNELIDGFNRALLSTPGETVQFNAEHTVERTSLKMQLRYADAVDNARYLTTLPPQIVLSEGQMAANGFSILCAASTAYQWSRWRALLLDDPLQHNDIIHAAAFVDVMRNLVECENYQLIMSSHKRDEGEFIARKFDAAGLPCTVVELIGASKDGVRIAPPRHNAAARHLLAEPSARTA